MVRYQRWLVERIFYNFWLILLASLETPKLMLMQHSFPHDLHNCSSPHSTNAHFLGIAMDQKWCILRFMCVGAWSQLSIKIIRVKHLFCHADCFLLYLLSRKVYKGVMENIFVGTGSAVNTPKLGPFFTMRRNLPKLSSVLISWINLLNFSLKNISQTVKKLIFVYFY